MSIAIGFPGDDEFREEDTGQTPARKELGGKPKKAGGKVAANGSSHQMSLFDSVMEAALVQKIWELLSALWTKILELEKKIAESLDCQSCTAQAVPIQQVLVKEYYTTAEFAQIVGLKPETVQTYLRQGKLNGSKTIVGRGETGEWRISHAELLRYQADGLLRDIRGFGRPGN